MVEQRRIPDTTITRQVSSLKLGSNLKRSYLVPLLGSILLSILLLVLLFACTDIDLAQIKRLLLTVHPISMMEIVLLMGFNSFLAGEKWHLVVTHFDRARGYHMPRQLYFALSAIGGCLGQVFPSQLATALCRSLAARAHGGQALKRGVGATVFEQLFDVFVAGLLGLASILVIITAAGPSAWLLWACLTLGIGFGLSGVAVRAAAGASRLLGSLPHWTRANRLTCLLSSVADSPLMAGASTYPLFALSIARFVVFVLIGAVSANALSLDIPLWQVAAAFPFAILTTALALTPGALGINEWTFSTVLVALGTPFSTAAQWAIATRILAVLAASLWGLVGILVASSNHWSRALRRV